MNKDLVEQLDAAIELSFSSEEAEDFAQILTKKLFVMQSV